MAKNFSRRCRRMGSRSRGLRSASVWAIASPVTVIAACGSRCAPPVGSGTTVSITSKRTMSWAVIFMLVAASCALAVSRHRMEAAPSGRNTLVIAGARTKFGCAGGVAPFAEDHCYIGNAQRQAGIGRARDRFCLAAFLGADAGIGAGGVHQRDDRDVETVGHFQQSHGFAIALRSRHAEIVLDAALGIGTLPVADDADAFAAEAAEAADDGLIVAEFTRAGGRG